MTSWVTTLGGWSRQVVWTSAVLATIVCAPRRPAIAAPVFDEYQVKAAFLLNLARFVEWPADAFVNPAAPVTFCITGTDPFGTALEDVLRGHQVGGRNAVVRRMRQVGPGDGCHVVFVGDRGPDAQAIVLARLGSTSVLTVAENREFAAKGGTIALFLDDQRVRFDVNTDAADRARLRVSSRVLALASTVYRKGNTP